MKPLDSSSLRRSEAGVALLISIFVLMLISVMALALIVSSGTESALAGNYRSSANVYYAALAGLEEGRGRLLAKNSNPLAIPNPLPLNQVFYILNPGPGENVTPTAPAGSPGYPDTEYASEFPAGYGGTTVTPINSVSPIAGLPPALYKWVRITAATEHSIGLDVDLKHTPNNLDSSTPLYYDFLDTNCQPKPTPTLSVCPPTSSGVQAFEVTSFAALPDGSQKLLQYVVAPVSSSTNANFAPGSSGSGFPAALTILGSGVNNVSFSGPNSAQFQVNGNDQCGATSAVYGIGYTNGISANPNKGSYSGAGNLSPNIVSLNVGSIPANLQTPSGLDALVQTITQNADVVITPAAGGPPADEKSLPPTMNAGNPMTVVVNGDFDLGSHSIGFGTLVVTGKFNYDTDSSWKGIILVIGQGIVISSKHGNGSGEIDGAMLVAQTRDSSGNLLPDPNLGSASYASDPNDGGLGIYYSSCWIKAAQPPFSYKILSYRQLSQ